MATVTAHTEPEGLSQRQRILQAAMKLFMERGYAATSTLAIASAVNSSFSASLALSLAAPIFS